MLWNVVFEFFVKYIFGGSLSQNEVYYANLGLVNAGGSSLVGKTAYFDIEIFGVKMSWGNYFSLIATIISMVAIVLICCALIKKIYNMCAHIIG